MPSMQEVLEANEVCRAESMEEKAKLGKRRAKVPEFRKAGVHFARGRKTDALPQKTGKTEKI